MLNWIILIGYILDLLILSLLAKKNIYDTSNESIACKSILQGLEIVKDLFERYIQFV